jgi:hypothetical protein
MRTIVCLIETQKLRIDWFLCDQYFQQFFAYSEYLCAILVGFKSQ